MERTERLLDLVALMLDATKPVSWAAIREAFPDDYGGEKESAERKFERDKSELVELGIPLTYQPKKEEDDDEGYLVDKSAYYLPEVQWTKEELAVLYAAGSAALDSEAFPGSQDLAHALRKIGFFAGEAPPAPRVRLELGGVVPSAELPERLELLWGAVSARKSVDLMYWSPRKQETTSRRVDPYGLALRRGLWSLVGYCHLRKDVRTFHVHRIQRMTVNAKSPKSTDFEPPPKDFKLDDYVATWPWQHRFHSPVEVAVELRGALAPIGEQLFGIKHGDGQGDASPVGGARSLLVRATDTEGLVRYVMSLGSDATVVSPPDVRALYLDLLKKIAAAHEAAS
ncbi:MAG: WYL domain-containing protein [Myxococcaceae bacterium]